MKKIILLIATLSLLSSVTSMAEDLTKAKLVITSKTLHRLQSTKTFDADEFLSFSIYYRGRVSNGVFVPRQRPLLSPNVEYELGHAAPVVALFKGVLKRNPVPGYHVAASLSYDTLQLNFNDGRNVYAATVVLSQEIDNLTAVLHRVPTFVKIDGHEIIPASGNGNSNNGSYSAASSRAAGLAYNVNISTMADADLVSLKGSAALANSTILSIINTAETIYNTQVDAGFTVVKQSSVDSGYMNSSNSMTLLQQFASYANSTDNSNKDIGHLFSGKNLDGSTIGLAYLGVICEAPTYSYGLTQVKSNEALAGLTFAHEIGHNLGASHDTVTQSLMSPVISPSNNFFSTMSLNEIGAQLASNSSCLIDGSADDDSAPMYALRQIKVTDNRSFRASASLLSGDPTDCTVYLYGAKKSSKLTPDSIDTEGTLLTQFPAEYGTVTVTTDGIPNKLKGSSGSVKLRLKVQCSDSTTTYSSIRQKILKTGGSLGVKGWLERLQDAL